MTNRKKTGGTGRRGFAAMDPEEQRKIARRGGEASHQSGRGHEFTSEEARQAGRLGGRARWEGHRRQQAVEGELRDEAPDGR